MITPMIVSPEAEADLAEAKLWYDARQPGLGDEFLQRDEETFEGVLLHPELHEQVFEDLRVALTRRFPFGVVFHKQRFTM